MHDDLMSELREAAKKFTVDDATRTRIVNEVRSRVASSDSHVPMRPVARRRTAWAFAGAAVAFGAAIFAIVALAPSSSIPHSHSILAPRTAEAALRQAGDAAGAGSNAPLGTHELFHVYTTSFTPDNSAFKNDPGYNSSTGTPFGGTDSIESWLDRDGKGEVLNVTGGGPGVEPMVSRDPKTGKISSSGVMMSPTNKRVTVRDSLDKPVNVSLMTWPQDGGPATATSWLRYKGRYVLVNRRTMSKATDGIATDAVSTQKQFWGIAISDAEGLPAGGPALDRGVQQLITSYLKDSAYRSNRIPDGTFGITAASKDREESIEQVVRLLGSAPLTPNARQAMFHWLSRQPNVTLDGPTSDSLGRTGTGVSFQTLYDRRLPARTVTGNDLVAAARSAGVTDIRPVANGSTIYRIAAHREFRRWSVRLIFDATTGQILQSQTYSSQRSPRATVPMLMVNQQGDTKVLAQGDHMDEAGAGLYIKRGRVSSIVPASPACALHPEVCQP